MATAPYFPAIVLAVTLVSLFVLRRRRTTTKLIGETLLLAVLTGSLVARGWTPAPTGQVSPPGPDAAWIRALAVVWWLIGARLVALITVVALGHDAHSKRATLFSDLLAAAIYVTAILIILNSVLDLHVNGLIATSGVIAIVLGLALQNTVADVFSGIAVGVEQPFHIGDRVSIGDHPEGIVVQANWRAIHIRTDSDDLATIPNSIVARSEIINRSVPTERRAASVDIPTLSTVRSEKLLDLARQALLLCPAILDQPPPGVVIKHIGIRTTTLGIDYHVATSPELSAAKSQLLRQVRRLFRHADVLGEQEQTAEILLANMVLFETLEREQIAQLAQAVVCQRHYAGGTIFVQGSQGDSLYIIRSGIFEVTRAGRDGRHGVLGRIGPGEYIGEVSMMSGDPRSITVTALTDAEVLALPRSAIEALLDGQDNLSAELERSIQRGLALLDRDAAARTSEPLDEGGSLLRRIRSFLAPRKV